MTTIAVDPLKLKDCVATALGNRIVRIDVLLGEVTVEVSSTDYQHSAKILRDDPSCRFEQLIDLCGVDYQNHGDGQWHGSRFCVVSHLLSVSLNQRLRFVVFAPDDETPMVGSITEIWSSANWYEREAFDLYGIVFEGHDDLRRILTDYGFIGHPFRKDFPVHGHVEMRYDEQQRRVIYQPVSIELRENTPHIIREDNYGSRHG